MIFVLYFHRSNKPTRKLKSTMRIRYVAQLWPPSNPRNIVGTYLVPQIPVMRGKVEQGEGAKIEDLFGDRPPKANLCGSLRIQGLELNQHPSSHTHGLIWQSGLRARWTGVGSENPDFCSPITRNRTQTTPHDHTNPKKKPRD